jgi:4-aminobutyrate--pyruvate transaminase
MNDHLSAAARRDVTYGIHPYTNLARHAEDGPSIMTHGHGITVTDAEGNDYIEAMAGLWCTSLGFGEEELVEAALKQMRALPAYHVFNGRSSLPFIDLAEKLVGMTPANMTRAFFANSGSEANDSLVKLVWYANNALGRPAKKKIISRVRGYHGVTIAAASLTGIPTNHRDFDLPIAGILHTDCPDYYHDAKDGESEEEFASRLAGNLERLILAEGPETVAAFIAEPVMGAGGVIVPPASYFKKIQEVLRRHDVLLFDDEVICGFGRTGNMFGCETFGFEPDAMTLAKQLSSGYMPISAVLLTEEMHEVLADQSRKIGTFAHGFTYGGHPVPAAVALRTMELMEERDVLGHVRRVAPAFQARIGAYADHPLVGDTRGVGLLGAVELVADKSAKRAFEPTGTVGGHLAARAEAHGLITRNLGDTMAFCPPLIIQEDEIAELFDRFDRALDETQAWVERENLRAA